MQFSYQTVELSKIDHADASFRISTSDASAALIASIKTIGLLNPPTLSNISDRYIIVSGFARVQACKILGIEEIGAKIVAEMTPLKACVQYAVMDNVFQREINLVEQARAVKLLQDTCCGTDEVVASAQKAGLALNQKIIKKLITVSQMQGDLQDGLKSGAVALPIALQLHALTTQKDRNAIVQLLIELNLSLNRQRELFEWIEAIVKRDQISIAQLLEEDGLQKIRIDSDFDRRQKVALIWNHFKLRRSPVISSFEKNYSYLVNQLQLKKGVRLIAPPNFEGTKYALHVEFQDINEMETMEQEFRRLVRSPHMARILNQVKK